MSWEPNEESDSKYQRRKSGNWEAVPGRYKEHLFCMNTEATPDCDRRGDEIDNWAREWNIQGMWEKVYKQEGGVCVMHFTPPNAAWSCGGGYAHCHHILQKKRLGHRESLPRWDPFCPAHTSWGFFPCYLYLAPVSGCAFPCCINVDVWVLDKLVFPCTNVEKSICWMDIKQQEISYSHQTFPSVLFQKKLCSFWGFCYTSRIWNTICTLKGSFKYNPTEFVWWTHFDELW